MGNQATKRSGKASASEFFASLTYKDFLRPGPDVEELLRAPGVIDMTSDNDGEANGADRESVDRIVDALCAYFGGDDDAASGALFADSLAQLVQLADKQQADFAYLCAHDELERVIDGLLMLLQQVGLEPATATQCCRVLAGLVAGHCADELVARTGIPVLLDAVAVYVEHEHCQIAAWSVVASLLDQQPYRTATLVEHHCLVAARRSLATHPHSARLHSLVYHCLDLLLTHDQKSSAARSNSTS